MGKQLIQTITVGSGGAANIEFTSIPQDATDLFLVTSIRSNSGGADEGIICRFNNDTTTSNYVYRRLLGTGSSVINGTAADLVAGHGSGGNSTSNTFGNSSLFIPNYASSSAKTASTDAATENNATDVILGIIANRWSGTAAITSLKLTPQFGTSFNQHSTASLYKFTKGSGGATVS